MDLPKHVQLFSSERLRKYVNACSGDSVKAVNLYKCNIQASQALYSSISALEVALRNAIDRKLTKYFNDDQWLVTKIRDLANHRFMVYKDKYGNIRPDNYFKVRLRKAEESLAHKNIPITHERLLSELTFRFWVNFFDPNVFKMLEGAPLQAFLNKPQKNLTQIHSHLNSIVSLRNRIAHNEPICFKNGVVCLTTIYEYETKIMEALQWIDTDLKNWCEKMNFLKPVRIRIEALQTLALNE